MRVLSTDFLASETTKRTTRLQESLAAARRSFEGETIIPVMHTSKIVVHFTLKRTPYSNT